MKQIKIIEKRLNILFMKLNLILFISILKILLFNIQFILFINYDHLMQDKDLTHFKVWSLKKVLLTYHLSKLSPTHNFNRWIQFHISRRNTDDIQTSYSKDQKQAIKQLKQGIFLQFVNNQMLGEKGNVQIGQDRREKLSKQFNRIFQKYKINYDYGKVVENILHGFSQALMDEIDQIPINNKGRKQIIQFIEREATQHKQLPKVSTPSYNFPELFSKVKKLILEQIKNINLPSYFQQFVINIDKGQIKERLELQLQKQTQNRLQQSVNFYDQKLLLLRIIFQVHRTISIFSLSDIVKVTYKEQSISYPIGYLLQLIKLDLGQQQAQGYMFIYQQNNQYYKIASDYLSKNSLLVETKKISLRFYDLINQSLLPISIPLVNCKQMIKQQLGIQTEIQLQINKKLINSNTSLQQIDSKNHLDVFQLIEFQVSVGRDVVSFNIKQRGITSINQCKAKYEDLIQIDKDKQIWEINKEQLQNKRLFQLKYQDQIIKITVKEKESLEFYGFTEMHPIYFDTFKRFTFEDDQYVKKKIVQKSVAKFPNKQFQQIFRQLCLGYIFSSIKKHSLISNSIEHIKSLISSIESFSKVKLWKPVKLDEAHIDKFNDTYIIYHLINSAEPKLKIELLRQLKIYYPVPLVLKEYGKQCLLFQEHFWVHNKAFNIISISFDNEQIQGKSTFLNYLFNTNFQKRETLHRECSDNIQISFNILSSEEHYINIIDVCNTIDNSLKVDLIKTSNLVIIHSKLQNEKYSAQKRSKIQNWLKEQNINIPYIIFYRDIEAQFYQDYKLPNLINNNIYADFPIIKITTKSLQHYKVVFISISKSIHEFIKVHYFNAQKQLWKFTDMLAVKAPLRYLNQILKEVDEEKENISTIINIQEEMYLSNLNNPAQFLNIQKSIRQKAKTLSLSQILQKIIKYCKQNQYYIGEIIKKIKDFLLLKKNKLCKDFDQILQMLTSSSHKYKQQEIKHKLSIMYEKIINSKLTTISEKANQQFFQKIYQFTSSSKSIQQMPEKLKTLKSQFYHEIYPKIFSIQLFWRELIYLYKFNKSYKFVYEGVQIKLEQQLINFGKRLIIQSQAFELINGDLLDLPKEFLNKIFEGFEEKGIMVIGIVGPQSSGKSTLLNFVLGCDFMSSVGRCTKGVYGTYYEITNKEQANFDSILILDTEGLMSNYKNPRYANRNNFDLKMLLFCMKICDIVIFNNRGEYTKQCKPLLQLTFDPQLSNYLNLPDVYFVINMNVGQNIQTQINEFQQFCEEIRKNNTLAQRCLKGKNIISLPYAFNQNNASIISPNYFRIKKTPKQDYIRETTKFNKLIQRILVDRSTRIGYKKRNLGTLITQINQRWHTLNNYPLLTKFTNKQIKNIESKIQQWENTVSEQLISYLSQKRSFFIEEAKNKPLQLKQSFLIKWKEQQIAKFQKMVEQKIQQFHKQFSKNMKQIEISTYLPFIDNKKRQIKSVFELKQKIIQQFFKQYQQKLAIEKAESRRQQELYELINSCLAQLKKGQLSQQRQKQKFHQYWVKNNKQQYKLNIDRKIIGDDLYQRYYKIYKKYLNKSFGTKQKYNVSQHYKQKDINNQSYQAYMQYITSLFNQKFKSSTDIFQFNEKEPVFSVDSQQSAPRSSKLEYFNMNDFYLPVTVKKYVNFKQKQLIEAIKQWLFYGLIQDKLAQDQKIDQLSIAIQKDFLSLGIKYQYGNVKRYIIKEILKFIWKKTVQNDNPLKIQHLIQYKQNHGQYYSISNKQKLKKLQLNFQKGFSKFYYNTQYCIISNKQIIKIKKKIQNCKYLSFLTQDPIQKFQQIYYFEKKRNIFYKDIIIFTESFLDTMKDSFIVNKKRLKDQLTIENIAKEMISKYIENLNLFNRGLFIHLKQIKTTITQYIINILNQDLKKIGLYVKQQRNFFKQIIIKKIQGPIFKFDSILSLRSTLQFGEYWKSLKNIYSLQSSKQNKNKLCKCVVFVKQIDIKQDFKNNPNLQRYKNKVLQYFKQHVNQTAFLEFIFNYIKQKSIFQKIMKETIQKIKEANYDFQLQIVAKIQKIIKEVNTILNDFNNDLKQICQRLIYDFQVELHSWAFHYFWKLRQSSRWNQNKIKVEKSNLQQNQQKSYQQFKAKLSNDPEIVNEKYAQQFVNIYKSFLEEFTSGINKKSAEGEINEYTKLVRKDLPVASVDRLVIEYYLNKIQAKELNQLPQVQSKQLSADVINYFLQKREVLLKYYKNNYQKKISKKIKQNFQNNLQNSKKMLQQMEKCVSKLVQYLEENKEQFQLLQIQQLNPFLRRLLIDNHEKFNHQLKWHPNKQFIKKHLQTVKFTHIIFFLKHSLQKIRKYQHNNGIFIFQAQEKLLNNLKTQICKQLCPCCKNICQNQNPSHEKHKCSNHNYRAVGGIFIKHGKDEDSERYPSYYRCDQITNQDIFQYDSRQMTWKQFKQQKPNWIFQTQRDDFWIKALQKLWNLVGDKVCIKNRINYLPLNSPTYRNQNLIDYIFTLDQSGSMSGDKWQKLKQAVDGQLTQIKNQFKQSLVSIIRFNNTVNPQIIIDKDPKDIDINSLKQKGGYTSYGPAFKKVYDLAIQKKNKNIAVIFVTDGIAPYPVIQVERLKKLKSKLQKENLDLVFITIFISDARYNIQTDTLKQIKDKLGGQFNEVKELRNLKTVLREVQIRIASNIMARRSLGAVNSFRIHN